MNRVCPAYVGVSCIDGTCPKANIEIYVDRCYDVVHNCSECLYYRGCEDCAFSDNCEILESIKETLISGGDEH